MPYFIFDGFIQPGLSFVIKGEEARHLLKSRRISLGESAEFQDSGYNRYLATVKKLEKNRLTFFPEKVQTTPPEPDLKINLFQAFIKEKALDVVIQKTTELGVNSICLFSSRFSQNINPKADITKKILRWRKIALEACKQSGRLKPPEIHWLPGLEEARKVLTEGLEHKIPAICPAISENIANLKDLSFSANEINVVVGPEGGWAPGEAESLAADKIQLGPRILRSETAAVSITAILQYLFGDLSFKPPL